MRVKPRARRAVQRTAAWARLGVRRNVPDDRHGGDDVQHRRTDGPEELGREIEQRVTDERVGRAGPRDADRRPERGRAPDLRHRQRLDRSRTLRIRQHEHQLG